MVGLTARPQLIKQTIFYYAFLIQLLYQERTNGKWQRSNYSEHRCLEDYGKVCVVYARGGREIIEG